MEMEKSTKNQIEREGYEAELRCLRSSLLANTSEIGDWKIVKYMEAKLLGNDLPYDINELNSKRQKVRDRINELEVLIANLEK